MKKVNFSDWQEMALKKDIEQIRKKINSHEPIFFSLCWEIVLALSSIIADHLFDTEKAPQWVWIAVIVLAATPALAILTCRTIKWFKSIYRVKKGKYDIKTSVDIFDNQISYWVMLSNAYADLLMEATDGTSAEKEFLYREGCYYNNKSICALYSMKPNFDKIFCDDLNTVHKNGLVDLERLYNLLSVMNEQQKRLDSASEKLESHGVERQYKLNKKCIEYLQNFIIDLNAVYKSKQFKWEE